MTALDIEDIPGVGPATSERLREAGYITVESIATATPIDLAEAAELGEATTKKIIKAAREMADIGGFKTGTCKGSASAPSGTFTLLLANMRSRPI